MLTFAHLGHWCMRFRLKPGRDSPWSSVPELSAKLSRPKTAPSRKMRREDIMPASRASITNGQQGLHALVAEGM